MPRRQANPAARKKQAALKLKIEESKMSPWRRRARALPPRDMGLAEMALISLVLNKVGRP